MADVVSRIYNNFRGVDFRSAECSLNRSPDSLNMWKDYRGASGISTRPEEKQIVWLLRDPVYNMSFYDGKLMYQHSQMISRYDPSTGVIEDIGDVNYTEGQSFVYTDENGRSIWYFKQEGGYKQFDHLGGFKDVIGYVPTTSIGRTPSGSGKTYQDVNMLTLRRKNTFVSDSKSKEYFLDSKDLPGSTVFVTVNDIEVTNFTVDFKEGKVVFTEPPVSIFTDGRDNVTIEFSAGTDQSEKILKCSMVEVFDNRVFFSGNPDYPNMIWHSSLDDPTYVSDLDYYQEGRDEAPVRGMVAGNNALLVFREPSDEQTTVFYHIPTIDDQYGKIYPSTHSSISTGCVGKAINFNDDIVFFSERGMEGISGDITTEQVLGHRSSLVDRKLTAEPNYKLMELIEWEGYLLVFTGENVYLADSRSKFMNGDHYEYEWFYWEFPDLTQVISAVVHDGVLYMGTAYGGIFTLSLKDPENDMWNHKSYWVTPKDKFNYPHKQKTTNKRGCVVEATGDVKVYAKKEDTDFELIGEYKGVTDYFVSRIKRKKLKDMQLKFESNTKFSLESVTMEAFIGGYIKG